MSKYISLNILVLIGILLLSCSRNASDSSNVETGDSVALASPDTLITFFEELPIGVDVKNGIMCILFRGEDNILGLYNESDGMLISKGVGVGQGPGECLSLDFVRTDFSLRDSLLFLLHDVNTGKSVMIDSTGRINPPEDFKYHKPDVYGLSVSDDKMAGVCGNSKYYMGVIAHGDKETDIPFQPELSEKSIELAGAHLPMLYSAMMSVNFKRDRIILPMYYFNMALVFDLNGDRINVIGDTTQMESQFEKIFTNQDYVGFYQSYATDKFCYMIKKSNTSKEQKKTNDIMLRTDWDGNVISQWSLPFTPQGNFSIVGDSLLYAIDRGMDGDDEIFTLVKYSLD